MCSRAGGDVEGDIATVDCEERVLQAHEPGGACRVRGGAKKVRLVKVNGQRYIGTGISGHELPIEVTECAGKDMAMFMDGPTLEVYGTRRTASATR